MIDGFLPIIGVKPRILILGSAPSVISIEKSEYYGNSRNAFWKIINEAFFEKITNDYQKNVIIAKSNNIAIWDVVASCNRKGSLDSAIKDVVVNPLESLLKENISIERVLFNGNASAKFYKRYVNYFPNNIDFFTMPSTSPAYTISYNQKLEIWLDRLRFKVEKLI